MSQDLNSLIGPLSKSFIDSNKKALTKFIKETIKDNPEPFRGYTEFSNAT